MQPIETMQALFLRQSMQDCWADYQYVCEHPRAMTWDDLVLTASNEAQAQAYRLQLQRRVEQGWLPKQTAYHVVADPEGERVGSGGSTLHVLRQLAQGRDKPFESRRILVLHSGGDSQRIPQYSACGKLFSRVPRALPDGRASTLFDESMIALAGIPNRMAGGMLVLSGDVLLLFNTLQIDLELHGAACLTVKAPVEVGINHGVFLPDDQGYVRRFLHKQSEQTLRALGAVNPQDAINIDTGAIWLDSRVLERLHAFVVTPEQARPFINPTVRLSFYGDFLFPMASDVTLEDYLAEASEGAPSKALEDCRRALWEILSPVRLKMIRLSPARFIHFGTTGELRALMLDGPARYGFLDWQCQVQSIGLPEGCAGVNSVADRGAHIGPGCYVEDSRIGAKARIASGCVLSQVVVEEADLPPDIVLSGLPLADGRSVVRVYGVKDNPKAAWKASIFGNLDPEIRAQLPDGDQALWTTRLYPVGDTMEAAMEGAKALLRLVLGTARETDRAAWQRAERLSLRESFALASVERILQAHADLEDRVRAAQTAQALDRGEWYEKAVDRLSSEAQARARQVALLERLAQAADFPLQTRLYHACHLLSGGSRRDAEDPGYVRLNRRVFQAAQPGEATGAMRAGRVDVALPVRVNFGGGWSDTPPYCLEHGGTVLNAALTLDGALPMRAWAQRLDEPVVRIVSEDLHRSMDFTSMDELRKLGDPHDPFVLGKAVLAACGLISIHENGPKVCATLSEKSQDQPPFERWGGGLLLGTASQLPKGSGVGGSSILAASAIRAVLRLFGMPDGNQRVMELALCVEQLMTTGGGWQDQAGALYPGMKLIRSRPGLRQELSVQTLCLPEETWAELDARLSFLYTGQRRLARNILREITDKMVESEPQTLRILDEIQRLAVLMAYELERGEVTRFARLLSEHWELSKALDPGSTNTCIDQMIRVCEDLVDGVMICGAGGGGFLTLLRKPEVSEEQLALRLDQVFQDSGVALWRCKMMREEEGNG